MCFTRVNRLYSVLKKYGSSQYHNKFCDLFAALPLPKVLNIQNLPHNFTCSLIPHINVSLKYLSYGIDDLYIVSAFLRCHHFYDDQKNLRSIQAFTAKTCTRHYVQCRELYIYSEVNLKTKR